MAITPLETSKTFVKQHEHPSGLVPASSVLQCFTVEPELESLVYIYNVGEDVINATSTYTVKNVTSNCPLIVEIKCPEYVLITPSKKFTLQPNQELSLVVEMDYDAVNNLVFTKQRTFNGTLECVVTPDNDTLHEPIYVRV